MDQFLGRTSVKSFTTLKRTPVLLACIYNKNGVIITHELLRSLFSPFGKVFRVI